MNRSAAALRSVLALAFLITSSGFKAPAPNPACQGGAKPATILLDSSVLLRPRRGAGSLEGGTSLSHSQSGGLRKCGNGGVPSGVCRSVVAAISHRRRRKQRGTRTETEHHALPDISSSQRHNLVSGSVSVVEFPKTAFSTISGSSGIDFDSVSGSFGSSGKRGEEGTHADTVVPRAQKNGLPLDVPLVDDVETPEAGGGAEVDPEPQSHDGNDNAGQNTPSIAHSRRRIMSYIERKQKELFGSSGSTSTKGGGEAKREVKAPPTVGREAEEVKKVFDPTVGTKTKQKQQQQEQQQEKHARTRKRGSRPERRRKGSSRKGQREKARERKDSREILKAYLDQSREALKPKDDSVDEDTLHLERKGLARTRKRGSRGERKQKIRRKGTEREDNRKILRSYLERSKEALNKPSTSDKWEALEQPDEFEMPVLKRISKEESDSDLLNEKELRVGMDDTEEDDGLKVIHFQPPHDVDVDFFGETKSPEKQQQRHSQIDYDDPVQVKRRIRALLKQGHKAKLFPRELNRLFKPKGEQLQAFSRNRFQSYTVIMPLEGLLLNTHKLHLRAWTALSIKYSLPSPAPDAVDSAITMMPYDINGFQEATEKVWGPRFEAPRSVKPKKFFVEFVKEMGKQIETMERSDIQITRGAEKLVENFLREGVRVSLYTKLPKRLSEKLLRSVYLNPVALGPGGLASDIKVHDMPQVLLTAALGVMRQPRRCVVLAGTPGGVTAAKLAGMKAVGVKGGGGMWQWMSDAHARVERLEDFELERLSRIMESTSL